MAATIGRPYFRCLTTWEVVGGLYSDIGGVTSVTVRAGQRSITEPLSAGTIVLRGVSPRTPPPQIGIPLTARLTMKLAAGGIIFQSFFGLLADYQVTYGLTADEDTWEMVFEDAFAVLGRSTLGTLNITAGTSTATAAASIAAAASVGQTSYGTTSTTSSAQTLTNENALSAYQTMANTEQARVIATATNVLWYARDYWINNASVTAMSDTGAGGTHRYSTFQSKSLADNYATKVTVQPVGGDKVTSGTGRFNYSLDSYSANPTDAQNLAEFVLAALDVDTATPTVLGFTLNGQDSDLMNVFGYEPEAVDVTFRGTTTRNQVIGYEINSTVEATRCQLYLASSDFLNFLILDSSTYGVLDTNRLGW